MTETQSQQQIEKPRISRLDLASFWLALYAPAAIWAGLYIHRPPYLSQMINHILLASGALAVLVSAILGTMAARAIRKHQDAVRTGPISKVTALLLSASVIIFIFFPRHHVHWPIGACQADARRLFMGVVLYEADNPGHYPAAEKWCDLTAPIVSDPDAFRCPAAKDVRCSYSINPDCEPNSPGNVVLLFESNAGWNSHGGAGMLTFENHRGKAASVVLNDGTVLMVRPGEVDALVWRPQQ